VVRASSEDTMAGIFWELGQNRRIAQAEAAADSAAASASNAVHAAKHEINELERRLDKLTLVNMALWELLQQKLGVQEQDLLAKIEEIDLRDGKLDGKVGGGAASACAACGRVLNARHQRCLYCGAKKDAELKDSFR
jgi:hypothetical protein